MFAPESVSVPKPTFVSPLPGLPEITAETVKSLLAAPLAMVKLRVNEPKSNLPEMLPPVAPVPEVVSVTSPVKVILPVPVNTDAPLEVPLSRFRPLIPPSSKLFWLYEALDRTVKVERSLIKSAAVVVNVPLISVIVPFCALNPAEDNVLEMIETLSASLKKDLLTGATPAWRFVALNAKGLPLAPIPAPSLVLVPFPADKVNVPATTSSVAPPDLIAPAVIVIRVKFPAATLILPLIPKLISPPAPVTTTSVLPSVRVIASETVTLPAVLLIVPTVNVSVEIRSSWASLSPKLELLAVPRLMGVMIDCGFNVTEPAVAVVIEDNAVSIVITSPVSVTMPAPEVVNAICWTFTVSAVADKELKAANVSVPAFKLMVSVPDSPVRANSASNIESNGATVIVSLPDPPVMVRLTAGLANVTCSKVELVDLSRDLPLPVTPSSSKLAPTPPLGSSKTRSSAIRLSVIGSSPE